MCQCPDGSPADMEGCRDSTRSNPQPLQQLPNFNDVKPLASDESIGAKAFNFYSHLVDQADLSYDSQFGKLSAQLPQGNIASPPNPEAAKALAALIAQPGLSSAPATQKPTLVGPPGQLVDPFTGRAVQLQPLKPPTSPFASQNSGGSYAACTGTSTFGGANPAYCEMGGSIYFQNGAVLRSR